MDKIVVDLEMCRINQNYYKDKYQYRREIIQIGAVKVDENLNMIDEFSTYVQPQYGKIDGYIMNLTGIHEKQIKRAPILEDALKQFANWIGEQECEICAWSKTDKSQMKKEILSKGIEGHEIEFLLEQCKWVDYQEEFQTRFQIQNTPSLKTALEWTGIMLEGKQHDGLDDAYNTARMIIKLESNPQYQISTELLQAKEESEELTYTIGNMFAGLFQATA